jgi:hypothetical protein
MKKEEEEHVVKQIVSFGRTFPVVHKGGNPCNLWVGIQSLAFHKRRLERHITGATSVEEEHMEEEEEERVFDDKMLCVALYKITAAICTYADEGSDIEPFPRIKNHHANAINVVPGTVSGMQLYMRGADSEPKKISWVLPLNEKDEEGNEGVPFTFAETLSKEEHNIYVPVWSLSDSPNDVMRALVEAGYICARIIRSVGYSIDKACLPCVSMDKASTLGGEAFRDNDVLSDEKYKDKKYLFSYVWRFIGRRESPHIFTPDEKKMADLVYLKIGYKQ